MALVFSKPADAPELSDWFRNNPNGYCIELRTVEGRPLLHRVGCPHLGVPGIDWSPIPVHCFADDDDLKAWYWENDTVGIPDDVAEQLESCDICRPDL